MQQTVLWIIALVAVALLALLMVMVIVRRRTPTPAPLPAKWPLTPRPVFTNDERRVFHLLREALPQNVVLFKLQLLRLCRPVDATQLKYWFDLLGSVHVSFVICSVHGRALVAIDLDGGRGADSQRVLQTKKAVLQACRVRYLRCPIDRLPTIPELELLVAMSNAAPVPADFQQAVAAAVPPRQKAAHAPTHTAARDALATAVASRRKEREAMGQDSRFQDSFFAQVDGSALESYNTDFPPLAGSSLPPQSATSPDDEPGPGEATLPIRRGSTTR